MGLKRVVKRSNEPDVITIGQAFDEYIIEKEAKNLSASSLQNYRMTYTQFINFHEMTDDTPITTISTTHIYKWMNTLRLQAVAPASINHYLRDLRAFLYWCMDDTRQYITKKFKVEMVKGQEEPLKTFTDDELDKLLEKPKRSALFTEWRTYTIINWILATGNRARTICNVKIGDVDFINRKIILRETKAKKAQQIPLSNSLSITLKEYLKLWRNGCGDDALLFPNVGEQLLTTRGLGEAFEKYCEKREVAKLKGRNCHGLRHTFAKKWVQENGNLFVLQQIMGHSTLEMTRKYVRLFTEELKQDYDKFNPLDNIKSSSKRTKVVKRNTEE